MSNFEKEDALISEWLAPLTPLNPNEFCSRWVPVFYNLEPVERISYRRACYHLLTKVTQCSQRTAKNWINYPQSVPDYIPNQLGAIDLYWRIRQVVYCQQGSYPPIPSPYFSQEST